MLVRSRGPINRAELSHIPGLSIPTVMKITDEFCKSNLLQIVGKRESTGGKRPELFQFVDNSWYIIGVDIGRNRIKVIMMNMAAKIVARKDILTGETLPAGELIERMIGLVKEVIESSRIPSELILGMGIGMPGLIDKDSGIVRFSPDFGWNEVDLLAKFRKEFDLKIIMDNANRTMALGEQWFGAGTKSKFLVCINCGYGIGAAMIEEGEIYQGSSGTSGEFGHLVLDKDGPLCDCGNNGCLEAISSGRAIARDAREAVALGAETLLKALCEGNLETIDAEMVFAAAKQKDPVAEKIIRKATEYLAIGVAGLTNIFDPEQIILAGGLTKSSDYVKGTFFKALNEHLMKHAGRNLRISKGALGDDGTAIGSATLVLKKFLDQGGEL